uniref:Uncharacterized protein n=1 Tax=Panagrellus redivivus TaxID=6233 RepID=A0A7E4VGC6_PANRE
MEQPFIPTFARTEAIATAEVVQVAEQAFTFQVPTFTCPISPKPGIPPYFYINPFQTARHGRRRRLVTLLATETSTF